MNKDLLRQSSLFSGLSDQELDRLYATSGTVNVPSGMRLIHEGDAGHSMYIVLDGEFVVTKRSGSSDIMLNRLEPGDIVGEMALLEQSVRSASVDAIRDSHVLEISQDSFQGLVSANPATLWAIVRTMTSRMRSMESLVQQNEKMAELGKLAAGLAHELNNPAAAARRSAAMLKDQITSWLSLAVELDKQHLSELQVQTRSALRQDMNLRSNHAGDLDALARSDMENELQEWLEAVGVSEPWQVAPVLVSFRWTVDELKTATRVFTSAQLPVLLQWLSAGYTVYELLNELGVSADRISEIVKVVKEYSYLDQAPIQEVDIHKGLENTLLMMRHRLKNGVVVTREYAKDLPRIEAYASELNQVWTNIIDNAIDAMQGKGELHIKTYANDGKLGIEICDNGPGIPPDVQPHIFDSFYTTKPIGVGTGLGLHIVHNIIVQKHHGEISVESQPGKTCFKIALPQRIPH